MKTITLERAQTLRTTKQAMLVDARSPVQYRNGTIDGAVNLPMRNFVNEIMKKPKSTTIVLYGDDISELRTMANYAEVMQFPNVFIVSPPDVSPTTKPKHKAA